MTSPKEYNTWIRNVFWQFQVRNYCHFSISIETMNWSKPVKMQSCSLRSVDAASICLKTARSFCSCTFTKYHWTRTHWPFGQCGLRPPYEYANASLRSPLQTNKKQVSEVMSIAFGLYWILFNLLTAKSARCPHKISAFNVKWSLLDSNSITFCFLLYLLEQIKPFLNVTTAFVTHLLP